MRHVSIVTLCLAFSLAGCQLPMSLPQAPDPNGQAQAGAPAAGPDEAHAKAPRMGTLRFAVRWPERDLPGFSAQVIPVSTRALVFELKGTGQETIRTVLRREAGNAVASTTVHLPVGDGYQAQVWAYAEAEPDETSVPIAVANASNLSVRWGETLPVALTLNAAFAPRITLAVGNGTPGQTLSIGGENLGRGEDPPVVIFPSGREVAAVLDADRLSVTIPTGAGSGQLKVRVDGVTSTSLAIFQEIRSLALSAENQQEGAERDGGDAIASWLGDSFDVGVVGQDTDLAAVINPVMTAWSHSTPDVGSLSDSGTYTALKLGTDTLRAHMGSVQGTRNVVVAPPAGSVLRPAGASKGLADHSLARVGDRWLAAWFDPAAKKVKWRMFDQDGQPIAGVPEHEADGFGSESERVVRVASTGTSALIAYRAGLILDAKLRNAVYFRALDPLTGAPLGDLKAFNFDTDIDSDSLIDLTASDDRYALGVLRFNGSKHVQRINTIRVEGGTAVGVNSRTYNPGADVLYYSQSEDAFSMAASGSQFVTARHFGTSGGAGPTALILEVLGADMNPVCPSRAVLHERNRVVSVATNGTEILAAALDITASGTVLKVYRYDGKLEQIGMGTKIADLQISGSDPLNWPLKLVWDGQQFILTYARMVGTLENGQVRNRPQAMVLALGTDGNPIGSAFPLARLSQTPTLVPTAEGGMALWLDAERSLVMRRVKYR